MEVEIFGTKIESFGKFETTFPINIGAIIDDISPKDIPYKNEIDIKKTLDTINQKFNMHAESVLLLDDDEIFLYSSKHFLQKLGHYVETYTSIDNAFTTLKTSPDKFSRLIVDQNMPDMNGDNFIKLVSKLKDSYKICLLTATIDSVPKSSGKDYSVIQKPCNMINIVGAASRPHIPKKRAS